LKIVPAQKRLMNSVYLAKNLMLGSPLYTRTWTTVESNLHHNFYLYSKFSLWWYFVFKAKHVAH